MRLLVAPTCFKENLSAEEVADAIAIGARRVLPCDRIRRLPLTDGGEGFARILASATKGTMYSALVRGPLGPSIHAPYALLGGTPEATGAIEVAAAAGLRLVPPERRSPRAATSVGVGDLLGALLDHEVSHVVVGCGDAGTIDGGMGLARALGVRFLDDQGRELPLRADALLRLEHIDLTRRDRRLERVGIEVACNLHTPLVGPESTAKTYGRQKSASASDIEILDAALERYAEVVARDLGIDLSKVPGAGASGGIAGGLHALLGATLHWRYDVVFRYIDLDRALDEADCVVTAEGTLDGRTFPGKLPAEVARRAKARGVPVVMIVGQLGEGAQRVRDEGVDAVLPLVRDPADAADVDGAMRNAAERLADAIEHHLRIIAAPPIPSPREGAR